MIEIHHILTKNFSINDNKKKIKSMINDKNENYMI